MAAETPHMLRAYVNENVRVSFQIAARSPRNVLTLLDN